MKELPTELDKRQENQELLACALKMLENVELQIQVTYDYEQLRALYAHKVVVAAMVEKYKKRTQSNCDPV